MTQKTYYLFIALSFLLFNSCKTDNNKAKEKAPKYIFYFIGDGMGLNQTALTEAYLGSIKNENKNSFYSLNMSRFPVFGANYTWADNRLITGSAASGTALACGRKTLIDHINTNDQDSNYIPLSQIAHNKGMKVGILTSVQINHATPACFYAKATHRNRYNAIASYLPKSQFDFFAGGTVAFKGEQKEAEDSFSESLKQHDYHWFKTLSEFDSKTTDAQKILLTSSQLNDGASLNYAIDQNKNSVNLRDYLKRAISFLDNDKGFFIMTEGGKIDWACHENDVATTLHEVIDFDLSIQEAFKFYEKHPDETLIIITADHETGGLTLGNHETEYKTFLPLLQYQKCSYHFFGDSIINPYIRTNKQANFEGAMQLVQKYFGLGDANKSFENSSGETQSLSLNNKEIHRLKQAYGLLVKKINKTLTKKEEAFYKKTYKNYYNSFAQTAAKILADKVGVSWVTFKHTASPVPVRAIGAKANIFNGLYDNTELQKRIKSLLK